MKLFRQAINSWIKNFAVFYQSVFLCGKNMVTLHPILENYWFNNQRK